ncbi:MAG: hypothetical protein ACR2NZ_08615 [Rubripirellula sp.]
MSLPISHAVLIQGATRLASNVAGRVGQAIGFDEILRGESASGTKPSATPDAGTLHEKITTQVQRILEAAGIVMNQPMSLRVGKEGDIHVAGDHPRAAEMESLLNADGGLVADWKSLSRLNGSEDFSIDLTSSREPENMEGPGGYPNW